MLKVKLFIAIFLISSISFLMWMTSETTIIHHGGDYRGITSTLEPRLNFFTKTFAAADNSSFQEGFKKTVDSLKKEFGGSQFSFPELNDLSIGTRLSDNANVRNILISTSWRSGSSFLGELLSQYPGSFYYFEPLHYYSYIRDKSKVISDTKFLMSLFQCQFDKDNLGYLKHLQNKTHSFLMTRHNPRLMNSCKGFLPMYEKCFSQEYLSTVCPLYPIRLIKTVRMRVRKTEEILKQLPNTKMIILVRDPRAVFSSRWSDRISSWCRQEHCSDPSTSCQDLEDDVISAKMLMSTFPGRVTLIRYEDLSLNTLSTAKKLFEFLNLPWHMSLDRYILSHTRGDKYKKTKIKGRTFAKKPISDPYGTVRNSTAAVLSWSRSLSLTNITRVQDTCLSPMTSLGYKQVNISDPTQVRLEDILLLGNQWSL